MERQPSNDQLRRKPTFSDKPLIHQYTQEQQYSFKKNDESDSCLLDDTQFYDKIQNDVEVFPTSTQVISSEILNHQFTYNEHLQNIAEIQKMIKSINPVFSEKQKNQQNYSNLEKGAKVYNFNEISNSVKKGEPILQERETMDANQALAMKLNANNLPQNELSNNKKKKILNQSVVKQNFNVQRRKRLTMDVQSLMNLMGGYVQQPRSGKRITLDMYGLTKMLENADYQNGNIIPNRNQAAKNSKSKSIRKKLNQLTQFELEMEIQKYLKSIEHQIGNRVIQNKKMDEKLKQLQNQNVNYQNTINRMTRQLQELQSQAHILEKQRRHYEQIQTPIRYSNAMQTINRFQEKYKIKIIKYTSNEQNKEFYGQFLMTDILVKVRKEKIKSRAQIRLTRLLASQRKNQGLFNTESLLKILNNIFKNYQNSSALLQFIDAFTEQYQLLLDLERQIQCLGIILPFQNLQINAQMDKLSFALTLVPSNTFNFHIDLMKMKNRHNFIKVYNISIRSFEEFQIYEQQSDHALHNIILQLINRYIQ